MIDDLEGSLLGSAEQIFRSGLQAGSNLISFDYSRKLKAIEANLENVQTENKRLRYVNSTTHDDMIEWEISFHNAVGCNSQAENEIRWPVANTVAHIKEIRSHQREILELGTLAKHDHWEKLSRDVQDTLDLCRRYLAAFVKTYGRGHGPPDAATEYFWGLSYVLEMHKLLIDKQVTGGGCANIAAKRVPLRELNA